MRRRNRRTPIARLTVLHNKARFAAVVAGVGCSILLLFLQLGFYDVIGRAADLTWELFDFDAAVVSRKYLFLNDAGPVPPQRLGQVLGAPGVADAAPINFEMAEWRRPGDPEVAWTLLIGVRPADGFFADPQLSEATRLLSGERTILADRLGKVFPPEPAPGTATELDETLVRIAAYYSHGVGFYRAVAITSDLTWAEIIGTRPDYTNIVLVRFDGGMEADAAAAALAAELPEDVEVLTRAEILQIERVGWRSGKPTGLMFTFGAALAFLVGAVILYQVLQSEVTRQLRELATMEALGFGPRQVRRVVIEEGVLYAVAGYLPAAVGAWAIYRYLASSTRMPLVMTPERLLFVLLLAGVMCSVAGVMALRRLRKADPADLF